MLCFVLFENFTDVMTSLVYCLPNNAVVVRCDCVGGLQWWPDSLPWSGPNVPSGSTQRGQEIGTSPEYCLLRRDVSTH